MTIPVFCGWTLLWVTILIATIALDVSSLVKSICNSGSSTTIESCRYLLTDCCKLRNSTPTCDNFHCFIDNSFVDSSKKSGVTEEGLGLSRN